MVFPVVMSDKELPEENCLATLSCTFVLNKVSTNVAGTGG